jgi:SRSO17 transposase
MTDLVESAVQQRFDQFLERVGDVLGNDGRRASFATYAMGLLGDGERKSIEPISARACADPLTAEAAHQRLLHFATDAKWSDAAVRRVASDYVLGAMTQREPVEAWIVDDTGFLKQGSHSVGVQRQYTGSAGKVANCQIGVSLSVATRTEHAPIDFELYIPESWANNPQRRAEARIPETLRFMTKPELGLEMIRRAIKSGVPPGLVLADSAYGSSRAFRQEVRSLGLHYAVATDPKTTVRLIGNDGKPNERAISVRKLARDIWERGGFRRCTWRQGSKTALSALFALRRVVPAHGGKPTLEEREHLWLLIEWRETEPTPSNYFLVSIPERMTTKQLVRIVMQRWRTERIYEDLKNELGLDHFEGRKFSGWHHHVSVALCCYAFVATERVRHFPPSTRGATPHDAHSVAA